MWRIFAEAEEVVSIEVPLYYYLFHQNSTMTSSSAERILTGYQAFTALTTDGSFAADFSERPFILPRWVLGALNSTARIAENYDSFFAVAEQMDYLRHMAGPPAVSGEQGPHSIAAPAHKPKALLSTTASEEIKQWFAFPEDWPF